jgi:hypothetical protein
MTVIRLARCRQDGCIPKANLVQGFFGARHGYSPLAAGSLEGLSSPALK